MKPAGRPVPGRHPAPRRESPCSGRSEHQARGQLLSARADGGRACELLRLPGHFRGAVHLITPVAGSLSWPFGNRVPATPRPAERGPCAAGTSVSAGLWRPHRGAFRHERSASPQRGRCERYSVPMSQLPGRPPARGLLVPAFDVCIGPGQRVGTARSSQFEDALALWGRGVLLQRGFLGVPAFVPEVGAPLPAADTRPRSRHVEQSCVVCCQWGYK